jgi:hypothetical protein
VSFVGGTLTRGVRLVPVASGQRAANTSAGLSDVFVTTVVDERNVIYSFDFGRGHRRRWRGRRQGSLHGRGVRRRRKRGYCAALRSSLRRMSISSPNNAIFGAAVWAHVLLFLHQSEMQDGRATQVFSVQPAGLGNQADSLKL